MATPRNFFPFVSRRSEARSADVALAPQSNPSFFLGPENVVLELAERTPVAMIIENPEALRTWLTAFLEPL